MEEQRTYLVVDMKSFYASCECVMLGLDPMTTDLVVADPSRSKGTILSGSIAIPQEEGREEPLPAP